jgi:hypothetical protein
MQGPFLYPHRSPYRFGPGGSSNCPIADPDLAVGSQINAHPDPKQFFVVTRKVVLTPFCSFLKKLEVLKQN